MRRQFVAASWQDHLAACAATRVRRAGAVALLTLVTLGPAPAARGGDPAPSTGTDVLEHVSHPRPHEIGHVIRAIRYERVPVFSDEDRANLPWLPLGFVNRLHVNTREGVIRRELLFAPGERVDAEALEESERKLRGLRVFSRVDIRTEHAEGDSVDVVVRTQELWSTALDVGYEKFEDQLLWNLRLNERNLLGTARSLEFVRSEDVDRSSWTVGVADPQLLGTRWRGEFRYNDADDGGAWAAALARPFFRLDDDWSWTLARSERESSPRYYIDDERYVRPDGQFSDARIELSRRLYSTPRGVWRAVGGYEVRTQELQADAPLEVSDAVGELGTTFVFPEDPDENRSQRTAYLGLVRRTREYEKLRFVDGMGNVEDVAMGPEFALRTGWTSRAFGGTDSGLDVEASQSWTGFLARRWLHRFAMQVDGLVDADGGKDLRFTTSLTGYHRLHEAVTLAAGTVFAAASRIDRHRVFGLGLESGLRAARFRELSGDRLWRGHLELRTVYTPGLWDIVTPGVTFFTDIGSAWFEDRADFRPELLRGAVGFGLRLGLNRAANDVPIRVDLAWPILYPIDQTSPVLSVGTGHVF